MAEPKVCVRGEGRSTVGMSACSGPSSRERITAETGVDRETRLHYWELYIRRGEEVEKLYYSIYTGA